MAGTFLCPNTCGFPKIVAVELSRDIQYRVPREKSESKAKYQTRLLQQLYKKYQAIFGDVGDNFDIGYSQFIKKLPKLKELINKWNFRKAEEKKKYLETFSRANWEKLYENRKQELGMSRGWGPELGQQSLGLNFRGNRNISSNKSFKNKKYLIRVSIILKLILLVMCTMFF